MSSFAQIKSSNKNIRRSQIGGAMGWDEFDFEMETTSVANVAKGVGGAIEDFFSLVGDIAGVESQKPEEKTHFPSQGSLEFNENKAKKDTEDKRKKEFFQNLKEEQQRVQSAKDRMLFEEEINDISVNMSTEDKNRLLHYQSSYKERSVYQKAALRAKIIEERRKADKNKKEASVVQTKPGASAMNAAFEGGSGTQGSGTANLSAQATG